MTPYDNVIRDRLSRGRKSLSAGGAVHPRFRPWSPDREGRTHSMDDDTPRATERSEGGSRRRRTRATAYPHRLILRLDAETMAMLEQDAKENYRTISASARRWIWMGREHDG